MARRTMKIRIRQGSVRLGECAVLVEHDDCVAVEVYCKTKYPILAGVKGDDGRHPYLLAACTKSSLDSDTRYRLNHSTKITFTELSSSEWFMFAVCEGGRYTFEVVFLRRP